MIETYAFILALIQQERSASLLLIAALLLLLFKILNVGRSLFIRACRVIKVLARGWPPAHLDADGDWKPEPQVED